MQISTDLECDKSSCETTVDETTKRSTASYEIEVLSLKTDNSYVYCCGNLLAFLPLDTTIKTERSKYLFKDYAGPVLYLEVSVDSFYPHER